MNGYDLEVIVDVHNDQIWIGIALRDYSEGVRTLPPSFAPFLPHVHPSISFVSLYLIMPLKVHSKHAVQGKRNRSSLGETTLQSSIAFGLIKSCDIRPGNVILDPLGGVGTICIGTSLLISYLTRESNVMWV